MKTALNRFLGSVPAQTDVWILSWATGIRWIGWGMAEPLIPIFLFRAFGDYGHSSLVDGVGEIVFLLVLPLAGILVDRIPMKPFLLAGLILFLFDGLWTVAAATQLVIFAFIANAVDGIAVASDVVGRATFIRRRTPIERLGTVFGIQNAIINLGFVLGAFVGLFTVSHTSLAWIFFGIVPTNLVALWLVFQIKSDPQPSPTSSLSRLSVSEYWRVWQAALHQGARLQGLAGLVLFFNALTGFATLLIPIYAYRQGAQLKDVVMLGIVGVVPEVFGSLLGGIADKHRGRLLPVGLAAIGLCMVALGFIKYSIVLLALVLAFRSVLVLLGLVIDIQVTVRIQGDRFGRVGAVFEGLKDLGRVAGAVVLGFGMDFLGARTVFVLLAVAGCLLSAFLFVNPNADPDVALTRAA
jgi:MFS family permease